MPRNPFPKKPVSKRAGSIPAVSQRKFDAYSRFLRTAKSKKVITRGRNIVLSYKAAGLTAAQAYRAEVARLLHHEKLQMPLNKDYARKRARQNIEKYYGKDNKSKK